MSLTPYAKTLYHAISDISTYSRVLLQRPLRPYQIEAAAAITESVLRGWGLTIVVEMSRQAGKNELSAIVESYLLTLYQYVGGQIVKASPTFKPQTLNSINRLCDRMSAPFHAGLVRKRAGYIVELGCARALFFSAEPKAAVVGATASILLEGDEAQDIKATKWDKDFEPMRASTNSTTVLWGTAWTKSTLLYQVRMACEKAQAEDGRRRVFIYPCDVIAACVPAYANHVHERVMRLGRNHPLVKTQYFLEEIDGEGGLFTPARQAMMHGNHSRLFLPEPGRTYAILIDVAGEDEAAAGTAADLDREELGNKKRDATAMTVVEMVYEPGEMPLYLARNRMSWIGKKHTDLFQRINALIQRWKPLYVVVDATGIGAGLTSFLTAKWGDKIIPFQFSATTKSDLGWEFLGIIETGRYQEYQVGFNEEEKDSNETIDMDCDKQFWYEAGACQFRVQSGVGNRLSWGVWESPAYDGMIAHGHDDLLISAALVAVLDRQPRPVATGVSAVVTRPDVLAEMDRGKW
jgi:hypothetical protein